MREPKTAKRMLRVIDEFLIREGGEEAARLWSVLTALRGPDGDDARAYELKHATTARIRSAALPLYAKVGNSYLVDFEPALGDGIVDIHPGVKGHFGAHVLRAVLALQKIRRKTKA